MGLNRARRARSEVALQHLNSEICSWLGTRRKADKRRQHATQLAAIEALLAKFLLRLRKDVDALVGQDPTYAFYAAAAKVDLRIAWLERTWSFLRTRLDQRDNPRLSALLKAADEVVWSCYSPVFDHARSQALPIAPSMPPPLPFVEPRYSPEAFPAELVPPELKGEIEIEILREYLNRMPISVVRVPSACLPAPWWLILLGHEIGHHVQYDLLPDRGLVSSFREVIEAAVLRQTGSEPDARRWGNWSLEIFADLFSVLCMGPYAVRAMMEMELTTSANMHEPRDRYPSPATRLRLLARTADTMLDEPLGTEILRTVPDLDASDPTVDAVITTALDQLPALGAKLTDLTDPDLGDFLGEVDSWSNSFRHSQERVAPADRSSARILVSAAFDAWNALAETTAQSDLPKARADLMDRTLRAIEQGAPEGERAGAPPTLDLELLEAAIEAIWQET